MLLLRSPIGLVDQGHTPVLSISGVVCLVLSPRTLSGDVELLYYPIFSRMSHFEHFTAVMLPELP